MIGVVDIGNTRTKVAVFRDDGSLLEDAVVGTFENFLPLAVNTFKLDSLDRIVIGSVVPSLTPAWADVLVSRAGILHIAGHDSPWGFELGVENPETVGVDRLANLEGALTFPGSVLVVDAGTATKFDLLEGVGKRTFAGGAIAPGVTVSFEAMLAKAAQLKSVDLGKHSPVVGYNTETAIRSGVLHGFASMVDGMVARVFEERRLPAPWSVVSTGGNASFLSGRARHITHSRPRLTLEGLYALAKKV